MIGIDKRLHQGRGSGEGLEFVRVGIPSASSGQALRLRLVFALGAQSPILAQDDGLDQMRNGAARRRNGSVMAR